MNPLHGQTRTKSVTPMDAGSHAYHTPPQMHTGYTACHTNCSLIHPLTHSATPAASPVHTTQTRALGSSPQGLGPSNIPSGTRARGPQTLPSSLRSRAIPKVPGFQRRWDPTLGPRPWRPPPPRVMSRAPSHLAAAAAARGAHGSARLHWRRSPRSRRCRRVLRGGIPGRGRGPDLPDSRSSHWLDEAAA